MFRTEWPRYDEGKATSTTRLLVNLKAIKEALAGENETCRFNSYCSFEIYMRRGGIMKDEVSVGLRYCGVPRPPCRVWNWPRRESFSLAALSPRAASLLFLCTQQNAKISRANACMLIFIDRYFLSKTQFRSKINQIGSQLRACLNPMSQKMKWVSIFFVKSVF